MKKAKILQKATGMFEISKGDISVLVDFMPFVRSLKLNVGNPFLFQHWNKVSGFFGVYDLASDLYECNYAVKEIDQRGQFWWGMVEISAPDTDSPLIACNACKGYLSLSQSPKKMILVGLGEWNN